MGLGGFFRRFLGLLPFIGKLLDNPIVRTIIIAKIGDRWFRLIEELINAADDIDMSNRERHSFVASRARVTGIPLHDSQLDTVISGMVAAKRRPDMVKVVFREDA